MPDLSLKALAILFQLKWNSRSNRPSSFIAKEALATFASTLNEDDVGFFYEPHKQPEICTHPGQLVGKISNNNLPYHFGFSAAIEVFTGVINFLDDNYKKMGIIVTDCFEAGDSDTTVNYLSSLDGKTYLFAIGHKCDASLQNVCRLAKVKYTWLADIDELEASLKKVIFW